MSLNASTLKSELITAFTNTVGSTSFDQAALINDVAEAIATAIDNYVKSAQINYTSGLVAPGGNGGPVTGSFTGNLS